MTMFHLTHPHARPLTSGFTRRRLVLALVIGGAGAGGACTGFTPTRDTLGDRGVVVRSVAMASDEEAWRQQQPHASLADAGTDAPAR